LGLLGPASPASPAALRVARPPLYLKAVKAAGTKDAGAVAKKLKELPVDDAFTANGHVQANGRMVSDLYLFQVKKPSESKRDWDYYKLLATVPGDTAYPTAAKSGCPLAE
jgi:branched-chain amino acid transport system substrate-binding protein